VTRGGFGTVDAPHLRIERLELVSPTFRVPLDRPFADLARATCVGARSLPDEYAEGPALGVDDPQELDPPAST
jgi:hypothetical protein